MYGADTHGAIYAATYGDDAPIAALATPLAETALALIRSSGKDAIARLSTVFSRPQQLLTAQGNSVIHGWIVDSNGQRIDETLVSVYRAPRSYTGEDGADISCHGGIATVRSLLRVLRGAGFREALPGEFTFRAFINGKLDLTRAVSQRPRYAQRPRCATLALRYLLGVIGAAAIVLFLRLVLPGKHTLFTAIPSWGEGSPYTSLAEFLLAGALGVWAGFGAPWCFLRTGLAQAHDEQCQ
jgi:hypothetical protein